MSSGPSTNLLQFPSNFIEALITAGLHAGIDKWYFMQSNDNVINVLLVSVTADVLSLTVTKQLAPRVSSNVAAQTSYQTYAPPLISGVLYVIGQKLVGGDSASMLKQFLIQSASSAGANYLGAPIRQALGVTF